MTLQGTLDAFPIPDVFQLLSFSQKTGALHLKGESAGAVYFDNGEVYFASSRANDSLGTALVRSGVVTEDAWKAAVVEGRGGRAVGEILVQEKGVDSDVLQSFLRERIEEAIFNLLRWKRGRFDFRADEKHSFGTSFTFPVDPLIAEGQRRLEEWTVITQVIPSVRYSVEMVRTLPEEHREVTLTRDEWRVLSCTDGRRTIAELAGMLGEGEFHTCQVLHGLVSTGLIRVMERPGSEPEAAIPEMEEAPTEAVAMDEAIDEVDDLEEAVEAVDEDVLADEASVAEEEPVVETEPEPEPEREPEPVPDAEPADAPAAARGELEGLSLAAAAAALEEAGADGPAQSVLGASASADVVAGDDGLTPSVFAELSSSADDDLLDDVLSTPPVAQPAAGGEPGRLGSAALAREFNQIASSESAGATASAPAAEVAPIIEESPEPVAEGVEEAEDGPPSPKSAGLNKTLILRLISGVKDL